jgi:hypothetical protein
MEEKQLRACLSHELGHLFIIELLNEGKNDESEPFSKATLTEPLSSIFGIFTIMDKSRFYTENPSSRFNHHSWECTGARIYLLTKKNYKLGVYNEPSCRPPLFFLSKRLYYSAWVDSCRIVM